MTQSKSKPVEIMISTPQQLADEALAEWQGERDRNRMARRMQMIAIGNSLRNAGAALQSISPPPPAIQPVALPPPPVTCIRSGPMVTCN